MAPSRYSFPVAVSQLGEGDSPAAQNARAISWLQDQPGGSLVLVTPRNQIPNGALNLLASSPRTTHLTWRGLSIGSFANHRVIHAWPDRQRLNDLWDVKADALVVLQWSTSETADWIEDVSPIRLLPGIELNPDGLSGHIPAPAPLPNGVNEILESIAAWAAGYSSGLKWNEEDKLKADMMNRPERWESITTDQLRASCRNLGMRPTDVDTIVGFLERRKQGRRFNVQSSYRSFQFK